MRKLRGEAGFTLIELMVTLGLVSLVIIGGFSLYFFADRSFVSGTITADIQADVQLAMKQISEELRLAHRLEFVTTIPPAAELAKDDHYLFVQDGLVVLRTPNHNQILTELNTTIGKYALEFDRSRDQANQIIEDTIWVKLSSLNPQVPYALEADLQVLNLRLDGIIGNSPAQAVYFTKTLSEVEREEAELVRDRCFLQRVVFNQDASELLVLRDFRDHYLLPNPVGHLVADFYYAISPTMVKFLEKQPLARVVTKNLFIGIANLYSYWS